MAAAALEGRAAWRSRQELEPAVPLRRAASQEPTIRLSLDTVQTPDGGLNPQAVQFNFDRIAQLLASLGIYAGNGTPEGNVTASKGALYRRFDGGGASTFYVKESGTNTNTGWTAK